MVAAALFERHPILVITGLIGLIARVHPFDPVIRMSHRDHEIGIPQGLVLLIAKHRVQHRLAPDLGGAVLEPDLRLTRPGRRRRHVAHHVGQKRLQGGLVGEIGLQLPPPQGVDRRGDHLAFAERLIGQHRYGPFDGLARRVALLEPTGQQRRGQRPRTADVVAPVQLAQVAPPVAVRGGIGKQAENRVVVQRMVYGNKELAGELRFRATGGPQIERHHRRQGAPLVAAGPVHLAAASHNQAAATILDKGRQQTHAALRHVAAHAEQRSRHIAQNHDIVLEQVGSRVDQALLRIGMQRLALDVHTTAGEMSHRYQLDHRIAVENVTHKLELVPGKPVDQQHPYLFGSHPGHK